MPRKAGNSSTYDFTMKDKSTGLWADDYTISLPSVSTILKVLDKPALPAWAYRKTRDTFVGLASLFEDQQQEFFDTFTDPDMAEEYLAENRLRPNDLAYEDSERGHREHNVLHRLAVEGLRPKEPMSGWSRGILDWWGERSPIVVDAECEVWSTRHQLAGTMDLAWRWRSEDGKLVLTDLKTRRQMDYVYVSDFLQLVGYRICWLEMGGTMPDKLTVLVVGEDGEWGEYEVPPTLDDDAAYLEVKAVYDRLARLE